MMDIVKRENLKPDMYLRIEWIVGRVKRATAIVRKRVVPKYYNRVVEENCVLVRIEEIKGGEIRSKVCYSSFDLPDLISFTISKINSDLMIPNREKRRILRAVKPENSVDSQFFYTVVKRIPKSEVLLHKL